ncbi:MAG: hypothetical protein QOF08_2850, partial [Gaiellales bacterium]|nr:hypothetical protein [Gaiellales bacterium]
AVGTPGAAELAGKGLSAGEAFLPVIIEQAIGLKGGLDTLAELIGDANGLAEGWKRAALGVLIDEETADPNRPKLFKRPPGGFSPAQVTSIVCGESDPSNALCNGTAPPPDLFTSGAAALTVHDLLNADGALGFYHGLTYAVHPSGSNALQAPQTSTANGSVAYISIRSPLDARGTVTLSTGSTAKSAGRSKAKRTYVLGRAHVSLRAGRRKRLAIHLSRAARRRIAHTRTLRAHAVAHLLTPGGLPINLQIPVVLKRR